MGDKIRKPDFNHERIALAEVTEVSTTQKKSPTVPSEVYCPSFDEEPWKSRAQAVRPTTLDYYTQDLATQSSITTPAPVPLGHPYVKLLLEFLDTVPDECWIDEENEMD